MGEENYFVRKWTVNVIYLTNLIKRNEPKLRKNKRIVDAQKNWNGWKEGEIEGTCNQEKENNWKW